MSILDNNNKEELNRVFELHQEKVQEKYKATSIDTFISHYYDKLSTEDDEEMYIELSRTETRSGHSEVLGWSTQ